MAGRSRSASAGPGWPWSPSAPWAGRTRRRAATSTSCSCTRAGRTSPQSPTRSGTRSGTAASSSTTRCGRWPRRRRSPATTSRPRSACWTRASSPATHELGQQLDLRHPCVLAGRRVGAAAGAAGLRRGAGPAVRRGGLPARARPEVGARRACATCTPCTPLAIAQVADAPGEAVRAAYDVLLDVRGELHRRTGRRGPPGRRPAADAGAGRRRRGARPGRRRRADGAGVQRRAGDRLRLRHDLAPGPPPALRASAGFRRGAAPAPVRRPLADDVVEQDGEVVLARDATPADDAELVLRVAEAAARQRPADRADHAVPAARAARRCQSPGRRRALEHFVGLLAAGPRRGRRLRGARPGRPAGPADPRSGRRCAASRSATATTGSPSTGT